MAKKSINVVAIVTTFVSLFAFGYFYLFPTSQTLASEVALTIADKALGHTSSYTFQFTAPYNLAPSLNNQPPGDTVNINFFPNGPQDSTTLHNIDNAALGAGSNISGNLLVQQFDNSPKTINVSFDTAVSQGSTVRIVVDGIVNPAWAGQYTANIFLIGPNNQTSMNTTFLLGVGQTYLVTGKVVYQGTNTGVYGAAVNANQRNGGQIFLQANAASNGLYTLEIPTGEWELRVEPQWGENGQLEVDWAYQGYGKILTIDGNKSANFEVVQATARIKGYISPKLGGWVEARSKDGSGMGGGINPDTGAFNFTVPAGSYKVNIWVDSDTYVAGDIPSFSINDGETKNLGTISLSKKEAHIKGKAYDKATGDPVGGVRINAWSETGWGETTTNSKGAFDLLVGAGEYEVMAEASPDSGYVFESGPPTRVKVGATDTVTGINFPLLAANSIIRGKVVDPNGQQLQDFWGFAMAMEGTGDATKPGPGTPVQGGQFQLAVPAGIWSVDVQTDPGSNFSSTGSKTVTIGEYQTRSIQIVVKENDSFIQGVVKDDDGDPVTGVRAEVFAENGRGSFKIATVNEENGTYTLGVVGGNSWFLGVYVEPDSGYTMLPPTDNKIVVNTGQTITKNFTILKADATINGKVLDPDGNGLSNVFVFADTHLTDDGDVQGISDIRGDAVGGFKEELGQGIHTGTITDFDGTFSLSVPGGTYGIGSGAPSSLGYVNPEFKTVTVNKDQTVNNVTLRYRESDATITGTVTLDGSTSSAFIWAWSESGGHSETFSETGEFRLNVISGDVWHIGADFQSNQTFYQSKEYVVDLTGQTKVTQNLVLAASDFEMPPAVNQQIEAASGGTIQMENGMRLVIPAGAFGSSGTYTVTITPTAQLAKEKSRRPVAFGYQITAVDSNGQKLTSTFNSNVRLIIPYTEEMLADIGISESQLGASFFDETSNIWQGVDSFTVNTDDNTIVASISHFTEFALTTGSADTTPPSVPTSVSVEAGAEAATLSWTNPTDSDFDHVVIYRSTDSGSEGEQVGTATGTTYMDTGLTAGTTYYYVLAAVDAVGNESAVTSQVSVVPNDGSGLPVTGVSLQAAALFYLVRVMIPLLLFGSISVVLVRRFKRI